MFSRVKRYSKGDPWDSDQWNIDYVNSLKKISRFKLKNHEIIYRVHPYQDRHGLKLKDILSEEDVNFDGSKNIYDSIIKKHLSKDWKIGRLGTNELNILRLSVFELKFFKKFDKKTIINEYVSLFNNFCGEPDFANGFLNNVLKSE